MTPIIAPDATDFFVVRTPFLPVETLLGWSEGLRAAASIEAPDLARVIEEDRKLLVLRLKQLMVSPAIREAVFVASRSTSDQLEHWLLDPSAQNRRLEQTLARYLQRMAGRATPFGLFAGCSLGVVAESTNLQLASSDQYRRHARIDNSYLAEIALGISRRPDVQDTAVYHLNSSLYQQGGRWRVVRVSAPGGVREHRLIALTPDPFLNAAIAAARGGASFAAVAAAVAVAGGEELDLSDVREFVHELIDEQVLVSEFSPVVTGPEALDDLIDRLQELPVAGDVLHRLQSIQSELGSYQTAAYGTGPSTYMRIEEQIAPLTPVKDTSRMVQVDLVKPAPQARLGRDVVGEIAKATELLFRVSRPLPDRLAQFKTAFEARYERQWKPLFEVLDEEAGIGFVRSESPAAENAPLLRGIPFGTHSPESLEWDSRDAFLLSKLEELRQKGSQVWELSESDIAALSDSTRPFPSSISATASLLEENGNWQVWLSSAAGPSGARMLGRFCHAIPELTGHLRATLTREESSNPEAVYAEVVHLPEGRVANVIARPLLRSYEIPYLGRSGAPIDRQIPVSDLLVTVANNRVLLRSVRLGRQVIPRLSTAHNFRRGNAVYRFLCSLQGQGVTEAAFWSWGPLGRCHFLPRVQAGRAVLSRAQWTLSGATLSTILNGPFPDRFRALQHWRRSFKVPRFVTHVDEENELPIDFENVMSVEAWLSQLPRSGAVRVAEAEPSHRRLATYSDEGSFLHQLIVPLETRSFGPSPAPDAGPPLDVPSSLRTRGPFSEWAYARLFTGTSGADFLLSHYLSGFIKSHLATGAITQWFFVRYGGEGWHVRLRLKGAPRRLNEEVLPDLEQLFQRALTEGLVWRMQLDTYEREIERYGGTLGMELCERIFWHDSESVLAILEHAEGDDGMDARWRLCARSWDILLDDFGLTLEAKRSFAKAERDRLAGRLGTASPLTRALGMRFREERRALEAVFNETVRDEQIGLGIAALKRRSVSIEPMVGQLREAVERGELTTPLTTIVRDVMHLHANRLLRTGDAAHELVLYDFLTRIYDSYWARRGHASE